MLADTLRGLAGVRLRDEDGNEQVLSLQPGATEAELQALEARLPCPIPAEIREALRVSKGLANGPIESFSLVDLEGFGLEEMLPHAYSIGHDGFGNYWVLDLLSSSRAWQPVFYVCHDPPVFAYQSDTVEDFLGETVAMWQPGPRSPVDIVHEDVVSEIWRTNPQLATPEMLLESGDPVLVAFASSLPPQALVSDLRRAKVGDGFSWGRFGPQTTIRRAGEERIWAIVPPEPKRSAFARIFGG
jgi:hypothetical protein